jgi:polyhydroxyalkanoate synthase
MINPPSAGKGGHWTDEAGDAAAAGTAAEWLAGATKHDGSWWGDWIRWLETRSGERIPAAAVGSAAFPAIGDAPGTYVLER